MSATKESCSRASSDDTRLPDAGQAPVSVLHRLTLTAITC